MTQMIFISCLTLIALGAANVLFSLALVPVLIVPWLRPRGFPRERAQRLLLIRIFPGTASLLLVGIMFGPLFRHEPVGTSEQVSVTMALLAALTALIPIHAMIRGMRSIYATWNVSRSWQRGARPMERAGLSARVFAVDVGFPLVALVGIWYRRIYISHQVLESLSRGELAAVIAHEHAHLKHGDNLRRLILSCLPDVVSATPVATWFEKAWAEACEEAADDQVARAGGAIDLASALAKVARLVRKGAFSTSPVVMNLCKEANVAKRMNRLLRHEDLVSAGDGPRRSDELRFAAAVIGLLFLASVNVPSLHAVTETVVDILQ